MPTTMRWHNYDDEDDDDDDDEDKCSNFSSCCRISRMCSFIEDVYNTRSGLDCVGGTPGRSSVMYQMTGMTGMAVPVIPVDPVNPDIPATCHLADAIMA